MTDRRESQPPRVVTIPGDHRKLAALARAAVAEADALAEHLPYTVGPVVVGYWRTSGHLMVARNRTRKAGAEYAATVDRVRLRVKRGLKR